MLLSHNWLKGYYTNPELVPAPEKVAELFTMRAFEVEGMEEKNGDTIYDLKLTADRAPYAYALRYVALELSLLVPELEMKPEFTTFAKTKIDLANLSLAVDESLIAEDTREECLMHSHTKIENVQNGESPAWLKDALANLGHQSRGVLVDLTNYVMLDTGQPLHIFDADKLEGKMFVGKSTEGEKVILLGGKGIVLPVGTLVIRDQKDILDIAGVKGGLKAEVDSNTKNIYLIASRFGAVKIRRTARPLNLLTDAAKRFEQNITSERFLAGQETYLRLLPTLQLEAKIHTIEVSSDVVWLSDESKLRKITVDIPSASISIHKEDGRVPQLLREFLEEILPKTGAKVENKDENTYEITQPHYRSDLVSQADVVDEFLRNKGYDFLEYKEPAKNKVDALTDPMDKLEAVIRNYFVQVGFDEVKLHTLVDNKEQGDAVLLDNALTSERNSLRGNLSTNMSRALEQNLKHLDIVSKKDVRLFEIGKVFADKGNDVEEKNHLVFGASMVKWPKGQSAESFIEEVSNGIHDLLNLGPLTAKKTVVGTGCVWELDLSDLLNNIEMQNTVLNDLVKNLPTLQSLEKVTYKKASIYPAMSRDIAFFGSNDQAEVSEFVKDQVSKYPLIENYFCFDVFSKEDKTSYAYRFVFQSYEKTLTEEEVSVFMNEIAEAVKAKGWTVR